MPRRKLLKPSCASAAQMAVRGGSLHGRDYFPIFPRSRWIPGSLPPRGWIAAKAEFDELGVIEARGQKDVGYIFSFFWPDAIIAKGAWCATGSRGMAKMQAAYAEETVCWLLLSIKSVDPKSGPRELPAFMTGSPALRMFASTLYGLLAAVLANTAVETTEGDAVQKGWRQGMVSSTRAR